VKILNPVCGKKKKKKKKRLRWEYHKKKGPTSS